MRVRVVRAPHKVSGFRGYYGGLRLRRDDCAPLQIRLSHPLQLRAAGAGVLVTDVAAALAELEADVGRLAIADEALNSTVGLVQEYCDRRIAGPEPKSTNCTSILPQDDSRR